MPFSTVERNAPAPASVRKPTAVKNSSPQVRTPRVRRVAAVPKGTPVWMCVPARALKRGDTTVDKTMLKEWRDYVISIKAINGGSSIEVVWMTPQLTTWKGTYGAADIMEVWRVKA